MKYVHIDFVFMGEGYLLSPVKGCGGGCVQKKLECSVSERLQEYLTSVRRIQTEVDETCVGLNRGVFESRPYYFCSCH